MRTFWIIGLTTFVGICIGLNLYSRPAIGQTVAPILASVAERNTAHWTMVQAIASLVGILVAGFAWWAATRSATAAEKALSETVDAKKVANRAYLSMKNYNGSINPSTGKLTITVDVYNGGATPAYDVEFKHGGRVCLIEKVDELDADIVDEGKLLIMRDQLVTYDCLINVETDDMADFLAGKTRVGVVVDIWYRDVFRDVQTLTCRMIASAQPLGPTSVIEVHACGTDVAT